jgi:LacI family transcriptional regulator
VFQAVPEAVAELRLEGYRSAFEERGRRLRPELVVTGSGSSVEAAAAVSGLLDGAEPPTALVTAGREQTVGALRTLTERAVRGRVAHVALDDVACSSFLDPPLTVVRYDVSRLATVAADILLERIGGRTGRPRRVVLTPSLVERGSGELRPG